ncbi:MAG: tetratricopeptide repeat protein [Limisphaerales bacterium]
MKPGAPFAKTDLPPARTPGAFLIWLAVLWMTRVAAQDSNLPPPALSSRSEQEHGLASAGTGSSPETTNGAVTAAWDALTATNGAAQPDKNTEFQTRLEMARHLRLERQFAEAATTCIGLIQSPAPEKVQRTALMELGQIALEQNNLPRAEQVYAQCLNRWPKDPGVPELLLRQGMVLRKMGLPSQAIAKFYSVMTTALVLKTERLEYYKQLVQLAQNEVAQTQYEMGNYEEAAGSFDRLLKSDSPPVNCGTVQYQYIRCLAELGRQGEAVLQALDFLDRFPAAPERPEVRFLCALSLKRVHRDGEALGQVLALLKEQHTNSPPDPQTLAYWQRRAGNELANRFYLEGDLMKALDIYLRLASLDSSAEWQLPVWYQIALVFERMQQPAKAIDYLQKVVSREKEVPSTGLASLQALIEMAKWRKDLLVWQTSAELVNSDMRRAVTGLLHTNTDDYALPTPSRK